MNVVIAVLTACNRMITSGRTMLWIEIKCGCLICLPRLTRRPARSCVDTHKHTASAHNNLSYITRRRQIPNHRFQQARRVCRHCSSYSWALTRMARSVFIRWRSQSSPPPPPSPPPRLSTIPVTTLLQLWHQFQIRPMDTPDRNIVSYRQRQRC